MRNFSVFTVGLVIWPVRTVTEIAYNVSTGTLPLLTHSGCRIRNVVKTVSSQGATS